MLYIAAIIEAEAYCSAELNISVCVTYGDTQLQNNPSLQSNIEEFYKVP